MPEPAVSVLFQDQQRAYFILQYIRNSGLYKCFYCPSSFRVFWRNQRQGNVHALILNSMLAFSTQVRGFKPSRSRRIFNGEKILSTPSFGREVKPSVPCRRFAACKRSLNGVEVVISAKIPDNILTHSSHFRRWDLSRRGGRGGTWW